MKERLIEFLVYLDIGQNKFERVVGLSIGYVSKLSGNITIKSLDKIKAAYPELNSDWLLTGEGQMLKGQNIQRIDTNSGMANQISGNHNTVTHNGSKDQVIEEQKSEIGKMFEAIILAVGGFQKASERHDDYVVRQDDYIKRQDEYIARIINNSYQRNKENMERFDMLIEQQNKLIQMIVEQNGKMQSRADRLIDLLQNNMKYIERIQNK